MRKVCLALVVATVACCWAGKARAVQQFYNEWKEVYLKENKNEEFVKMVDEKKVENQKVQCMVCHQGKNRKNRNPYGAQLDVLLDKRKDVRDTEKMRKAFEEVGKMHIDPKDEKSPTFDEVIKSGKLPGGDLEEVIKEPAEEKK